MLYTVIWTVDIDAETPEEAARMALEMQRDPESSATVFDVYRYPDMQDKTVIDLPYNHD